MGLVRSGVLGWSSEAERRERAVAIAGALGEAGVARIRVTGNGGAARELATRSADLPSELCGALGGIEFEFEDGLVRVGDRAFYWLAQGGIGEALSGLGG